MKDQVSIPKHGITWVNAPAHITADCRLNVYLPNGQSDYRQFALSKKHIADLPEYHRGKVKDLLTQFISGAKNTSIVPASLAPTGTSAMASKTEIEDVRFALENFF